MHSAREMVMFEGKWMRGLHGRRGALYMTSQTIRKLNNVEHDAYGYALA